MEAEDKRVIQEEILRKFAGTDPEMDIDWEMIEISFKAGYEKSVLENVSWANVKYAHQLGIREVVEWVLGDCDCPRNLPKPSASILNPLIRGAGKRYSCWRCIAKLKEWGMKED